MLLWCDELSIPAVSLWVLSTENFRRDASEVSGILETVEAKLVQLARHPRTHRLGVRVRAVGKLDLHVRLLDTSFLGELLNPAVNAVDEVVQRSCEAWKPEA